MVFFNEAGSLHLLPTPLGRPKFWLTLKEHLVQILDTIFHVRLALLQGLIRLQISQPHACNGAIKMSISRASQQQMHLKDQIHKPLLLTKLGLSPTSFEHDAN